MHRTHAETDRFVYNIITNRGRALDILSTRLKLAMDLNQQGWNEEDSMKKVSLVRHWKIQALGDNGSNLLVDNLVL